MPPCKGSTVCKFLPHREELELDLLYLLLRGDLDLLLGGLLLRGGLKKKRFYITRKIKPKFRTKGYLWNVWNHTFYVFTSLTHSKSKKSQYSTRNTL